MTPVRPRVGARRSRRGLHVPLVLVVLPLLSATFSHSFSAAAWVVQNKNTGNSFKTLTSFVPQLVEQVVNGGATLTSVTLTLGSATTTGDWLILAVADDGNHSSTVSSVSGGGVSSWTKATGASGGNNVGDAEIWYGLVTSGSSASVTVPLSGSTNVQLANVAEWSGIASTSPSRRGHQLGTGYRGHHHLHCRSHHDHLAEDLVLTDAWTAATGDTTPQDASSGYTTMSETTGGGSYYRGWAAYQDDATTGSISATWTAPSSADWATAVAAFKPA